MKHPRVDIRRIGDLRETLKESLDALGWKRIVKPGAKVTIKVNGTHFTYLPGLTTTPQLVGHYVEILRDRASEVIVGESDLQRVSGEMALKGSGIQEVAERAGAKVLNFSKDKLVTVKVDGEYFKELAMPASLLECDVFSSMPLFKTHKITGVTLTLKNQFGTIPDDMRLRYHGGMAHGLPDLEKILRTKLIVMDGRIGLESDGPIAGLPKKLGVLLTSTNSVAADSTACRIMGFDPYEIDHIRNAGNRGLGPLDTKQINFTGVPWKDVFDPFERANRDTISILEKIVAPYPKLSKLVYKDFFDFNKWLSWKVRTLSGYKKKYVQKIEATGLWE